MIRPARGALGFTLCLVMSSAPAAAEPARPADALYVDYLYINASEGSASGGHAALRFGDQVFHFEHREPGIIVLARNRFDRGGLFICPPVGSCSTGRALSRQPTNGTRVTESAR